MRTTPAPESDAPAMEGSERPTREPDPARALPLKRCGGPWVFDLPPDTPALTAAQVAELLADTP